MFIYKVSQSLYNGYDSYDSMIVYAENELEARMIHPGYADQDRAVWDTWPSTSNAWITKDQISYLEVEMIGRTRRKVKCGVILASFNAG
jgi:hypothetical protein